MLQATMLLRYGLWTCLGARKQRYISTAKSPYLFESNFKSEWWKEVENVYSKTPKTRLKSSSEYSSLPSFLVPTWFLLREHNIEPSWTMAKWARNQRWLAVIVTSALCRSYKPYYWLPWNADIKSGNPGCEKTTPWPLSKAPSPSKTQWANFHRPLQIRIQELERSQCII